MQPVSATLILIGNNKLGSDILQLIASNTYSGGTAIEDDTVAAGVLIAGQATSFTLGKGAPNGMNELCRRAMIEKPKNRKSRKAADLTPTCELSPESHPGC